MTQCTVYALKSSLEDRVRYVGQTTATLQLRLKQHRGSSAKTAVAKWCKTVAARGGKVLIVALEENAVIDESEIRWIAHYRALDSGLLNHTDGGGGTAGHKMSEAHKQKLIAAAKGRVDSEATRARRSQARREVWASKTPEERAAIGAKSAAKLRGIKRSEEFCRRVGDGHRGKPLNRTAPVTAETRAKLSAAAKGRMPTNLADLHAMAIGKPKSPEQRQKIAEALRGRKHDPELVARRNAAARATFATPEAKARRAEASRTAWTRRKEAASGMEA